MSYPDKEKHTDYQPDSVETSKEELNNQRDDTSSEDEKDTLPVGQLKWRKDEEYEQDTHQSLGLAKKQNLVENKDKNGQPNTGKDGKPQDKSEVSEGKEKPDSEDVEPPFTPNKESSDTGRKLSLEDTLTPINFKEYSIGPAFEQKDNEEFKKEEEKPSFVAKPDLMAPGTPAQRKKENTFAGGKEWKEEKQIPKWIRTFWLPLTLIVVLFAGLIIGHSVIGGQPVSDIFDIDMWIHVIELMYGS